MALLMSELQRIKVELGYNALTLSALPYAFDGISAIFEQIVQPYLQFGELNASATCVPNADAARPVTLRLNTVPTAIKVGDRLIVDQDDNQEAAHVTAVTAMSVTVALQNPHEGTYPVTVEGGESIAREYLRECILVSKRISKLGARAGIQQVDGDLKFFATTMTQKGPFGELQQLQRHWRNELSTCLGVENLREAARGAGQLMENY